MLSSSTDICSRLMVTSCLRATMLEKISASMVSPFRKFSHVSRVWIQSAIQKSIGTGVAKKIVFLKILTHSNESQESCKIEIFQSQP